MPALARMARTLRGAAGGLRLELVVPFWWDGKTALLDGLAPLVDSFRLQSTREIDGSATTFHKDKQALLRLLPALELDFSAWGVAFGGLALHELR
jgi:hypothetical protein